MTLEIQEIRALAHSFTPFNPMESPSRDPLMAWLWLARDARGLSVQHPRLSVFWANHGFSAARSPDDSRPDRAASLLALQQLVDGKGAVVKLCEAVNADLRVYEMDLDTPTGDVLAHPAAVAMSEEDFSRAVAYGMMAVEPGVDILAIAASGHGSETGAQAIVKAIKGDIPANPVFLVDQIAARGAALKGFERLAAIGGFEVAALAGAMIAARLAHIPVIGDGPAALAAWAILREENPASVDHVRLTGINQLPAAMVLDAPVIPLPVPVTNDAGVAAICCLSPIRNMVIMENVSLSNTQNG